MTNTISATELKKNTSQILNQVALAGNITVVKRHGKDTAVIMSATDYEGWQETNEILADKKLMKDLREAEEDIKNGRVYDWEDVKKELGLDVQDKINRQSKKSIKKSL